MAFERSIRNRGCEIPVEELRVGDSVDLQDDPIADPDGEVDEFGFETGHVVAIGEDIEGYKPNLFEGDTLVEFSVGGGSYTYAFPEGHLLVWTNCLELVDEAAGSLDNPGAFDGSQGGGFVVQAETIGNDGSRQSLSREAITTGHTDVPVKFYRTNAPTIFAGFRANWIDGKDPETGTTFDLCAGAGFGSKYMTLTVELSDGTTVHEYVDITEVLQARVGAIIDEHEKEN